MTLLSLKNVLFQFPNFSSFTTATPDPIFYNLMLQCFLFTKLKKRLANVIPSKRPQGKVPTRSSKRVKLLIPEPGKYSL